MYDGGLPFDEDYMEFAAPPPSLEAKWLALIKPLELYMWMATGASVLVVACVFYFLSRYAGQSSSLSTSTKIRQLFMLLNFLGWKGEFAGATSSRGVQGGTQHGLLTEHSLESP